MDHGINKEKKKFKPQQQQWNVWFYLLFLSLNHILKSQQQFSLLTTINIIIIITTIRIEKMKKKGKKNHTLLNRW